MHNSKKNIIIVLNAFIKSHGALLRKSAESVAWIKEVDIVENNLEYVLEAIRNVALWLKEHETNASIEILYVFDTEVLDLVVGQRFPELTEVREIVRERALEDGEKFLGMLKQILAANGLSAATKLREGKPAAEVEREAAELGASLLIVGESGEEIKKKSRFPVLEFNVRGFRIADELQRKPLDAASSS